MEAVGPGEGRAGEEAGGGDGGEVQDLVSDRDAGPGRRAAVGPEDAEREVLDREVGGGADVDEGLEGHREERGVAGAPTEGGRGGGYGGEYFWEWWESEGRRML